MAVVRLPALLAREAGASRVEVDAATLGEALRGLPVAGLVLDEHGALRPLVHAYVDGSREHDLAVPLDPAATVILVAAVAGGAPHPEGGRRPLPLYAIATIRSIASRAFAAISSGTVTR